MKHKIPSYLKPIFGLMALWIVSIPSIANSSSIVIGDLSVAPGEKLAGEVSIATKDEKTSIPLTIINGEQPGPTLLVLAGIHGSEYSPIVATQRLAPKLNPQDISGAVIIVHIANMPAYLGRTVYISPVDGKNLNRSFPGKPNGTITERIAYFLTNELYPLSDAVLDMHSGDGNEQLLPSWTAYYGEAGSDDVVSASRAMAYAFGLSHIVEFQWQLTSVDKAIWAGSAAVARDIPSIDVEAGGMGIFDEQAIDQIEEGVRRVMAHMGITKDQFPAVTPPKIIKDRHSITAPQNGSWVPLIDAGSVVKKGDLIGYLTDWHGNHIFEAHAPITGLMLLRLEAPPAAKGETLAVIATIE
jgi:predicted deacylase